MKTNYFLSLWISNLGVEPLIAIAFFLLDPAFLAFNLLLHRVCVVFEAMSISLRSSIFKFNKFRNILLSLMANIVKTFLIATPCIAFSQVGTHEDIFLSKGEQTELSVQNLKHFSVGNNSIITYKYRPQKKSILIKAKMMGFTDLVAWSKGHKKTYRIFITSKKQQLKKMQLIQALKKSNIKTSISGSMITLSGIISNTSEYIKVQKIKMAFSKDLIIDLALNKEFRNSLIGEIYFDLYQQGAENVNCHTSKIQIRCDISSTQKLDLKIYKNDYGIFFNTNANRLLNSNYELSFHIVMIDSANLETDSMGLDQARSSVADLLSGKPNFSTGDILFKNSDLEAKVVATPQIISTLDEKFSIQLGGQVPFHSQNEGRSTTKWKFAGLKIKGEFKIKRGKIFVKYNSQFTRPAKDIIEGPMSSSSIFIELGTQHQLSEINYASNSVNDKNIPGINKIPLLRTLFSTTEISNTKKTILCFLTVTEKK